MWIRFKYKYLFLWTALVMLACLMPAGENTPEVRIPHFDKMVHAGFYFIASLLYYLENKTRFYLAFMLSYTLVLGGIIEWVQYCYIPSRSGELWDMLANLSGPILFFGLLRLYLLKNR